MPLRAVVAVVRGRASLARIVVRLDEVEEAGLLQGLPCGLEVLLGNVQHVDADRADVASLDSSVSTPSAAFDGAIQRFAAAGEQASGNMRRGSAQKRRGGKDE